MSNSVSIIRIIIPRCHEHFKRSTEGPGIVRTTPDTLRSAYASFLVQVALEASVTDMKKKLY